MSSGDRSTSISRRGLLQAAGAVPLAVAAVGVAGARAAATPAGPPGPGRGVFDVSRPGTQLFSNRYLAMVRTVMQSFAVDPVAGHVYVLQIVQANTPLPGDAPGDEAYARRVVRGDLSLTRLDLAGNRLGHMYLKHFGHGVQMGLERDGDDVHLWTEIDSLPNAAGEARGSRLTRFRFADGAVLDAEADAGLFRRDLLPGVTQTTCNIDPLERTLVMRYYGDEEFRYALFDLDHVTEERASYEPLLDIGTPAELEGNVFQGYATFGEHLYLLDGTAYGASNPPPPAGTGNAHLTRVGWRTGEVEQADEVTGVDHHRREPEGLAVALERGRRARLYGGFATSAHESVDADRLCTIYHRDTTY